ncbi:S1 family peptidase [Motilibacter deserti]|uniref:Trypsin-like serine protease n=1 Tax=Motilibacter deserti TaxID=2714956 RepID=A0ABX0H2P5_9ACTN|nr:trypsin-like serine protease [Motilibacter deserti]
MRERRRALSRAAVAGALLGVLGAALPASPASATPAPDEARAGDVRRAVTHGTIVPRPSRTAPWVVSLWLEDQAPDGTGTGRLSFVCTGSAIGPRQVLTAAHCTRGEGLLHVQVGADTLQGGTTVPVEAVRAHARYRDAGYGDDLALLRPLFALRLRAYARLASPRLARGARTGQLPLRLYGWGETEAGRVTGALRTTPVRPAPDAALRAFGADFAPGRMLAAGRQDAATGRYAGACSGDSGGPLAVRQGGTSYVVGVTSYGAARCDTAPTVFASVGDYRPWTTRAARDLPVLARTANTALPVALGKPSVQGTAALGATLTCAPGAWSTNTSEVETGWFRGPTYLGAGADHVVTAEDAGRALRCTAVATSQAGSTRQRAPEPVRVPELPRLTALPLLAGLEPGAPPAPGGVVSCVGAQADDADTALLHEWLASPGSDLAGAQVVGSGPAIVLDAPLLARLAGGWLTCRVTATNVMGAASATVSAYVPVAVPAPAPTPGPTPVPSSAPSPGPTPAAAR